VATLTLQLEGGSPQKEWKCDLNELGNTQQMTLVGKRSEANGGSARGKSAGGASRVRELAQTMERDIHLGRLSAGLWLKQVDLEEKYGASRFDIRHALDRLEEKGLVKLETNRGYRVEEFNVERFRNLESIRAILEVAAAEHVLTHIDSAGIDRMEKEARRFSETVSSGTSVEQEEANRDFHAAMLAYCPNKELVAMIFDLRNRIPVAFAREKNTAAILANSDRTHFEIIECLRKRDKPGLVAAVRRHVLPGAENS
jgi:DNA-binding GntR family transcriptional regulator